ncbi:MAG: regulatory protein RecX [Polyangiales bacterium]
MAEDEGFKRVYSRALAMLAARARLARDLRRKLIDKGEEAATVDAVIKRLLEQKFLDDRAFAAAKARSSVARGRSSRRAALELTHKGIDRETASTVVAEALDERGEDESAVCERAARKKLRSLSAAEPAERRRKLWAFLARQGFSGDAVRKALRAVLDAAPSVEGDLAADGDDLSDP